MSVELQATSKLIGGVRKAVKDSKFRLRKGKKGKGKEKEEATKKPSKSKPSPSTSKTEPEEKASESKSIKAHQPMLPGMRGAVKREPVKAPAKVKKETPPKSKYSQPMLPGMNKPGKKSSAPKSKEPVEETFIPGGVSWSKVAPVNLDSPSKGRQFGG